MQTNTKKMAESILGKSMAALGIHLHASTDPETVRSVLQEMKLDDFQTTWKPVQKFLQDAITIPQSFTPMLQNIVDGIVNKHPAVVEFAELALEKRWLSPSPHIQRAVHVTYILDALTAAMCNNHKFFVEVQEHLRSKEKEYGIDSTHPLQCIFKGFSLTHSFFETAKGLSGDALMSVLRVGKEYMHEDSGRNFIEHKLLTKAAKDDIEHVLKWIQVNIYEAGISDYKKGLFANALVAEELNEDISKNPPLVHLHKTGVVPECSKDVLHASLLSKDNVFLTFDFTQAWTSLYATWNMAFVLGNLDELDIVLPKLFIPSFIDAKPENFMSVRFISLWLTLNNAFFRECDDVKKLPKLPHKKEMAAAWGRINKKYAFELAAKETRETPKMLMEGYYRFYSHPVFHFLQTITRFSVR